MMLPCVQGYDTKWIVIDYGSCFVLQSLDFFLFKYFAVVIVIFLDSCREVCGTCT